MIWQALSWAMNNLLLIVWAAGVLLAWRFGGWRLALVVLTFGVGSVAYNAGRKAEKDNLQKRVEKIQQERQNEYDKIDARGTDRSDVVERLRDGSY